MSEILTRKDAIANGSSTYFTGIPCKHGHVAKRYTNTRTCLACNSKYMAERRSKNPEKQREYKRQLYAKNPLADKQRANNWRKNNLDKAKLIAHEWRKQNKGKCLASGARYKLSKAERMPKWLNAAHLFEMECVYSYCSALRAVGLDYHVDHVVPLRGKKVSGLHVPWNLQVIPANENMSKGNRLDD